MLEKVLDTTLQIQPYTELGNILQGTIADARDLLQTDRVLIYRFLPGQDAVVAFESVGVAWTSILGQLIYDPCLYATWVERYQQGQTTAISDARTAPISPCYVQLLNRMQVLANLVAPIFSQGELWGLLIAHHCRSPRQWQPLDVRYVQQIARHLGIAIQHADLRQYQRQLESQLEQRRIDYNHDAIALKMAIDTTDRKLTELALATSQQHYQNLVNNSPDIIERFDTQFRHLYISPALTQITGIPAEAFLGKTCRELGMDATMVNTWEMAATKLLATAEKQVIEFIAPTRNGAQSFEMVLVPELSDQKTIESILCISRDVSDRKAAELALRQQAERQRLMMAITQHIRQTLDLDQVLHTTVTEVRRFLQVDRVLIYKFNADWSGIIIAESVADGWSSVLGMRITDTYFVTTQGCDYRQGRSHSISDIYTAHLDPCHVELLEQMQVRAKLIVPILQDEHLWGLLVAQHCRSPRHWEAWETDLQQQLATQIAIALQQSELYQQVQSLNTSLELQVQERTAQLKQALDFEALLKRITDHVRDSLDETKILQTAVEELATGLPIAACDAGIYNPEQTASTIAYEVVKTLTPSQGTTIEFALAPHAEIYPLLLQGATCHFSDIIPNSLRSGQELLTTLAVPIVDDQGVLGDLWLFKPLRDAFNDQEIRLVQQVANQCAIALRQSRLYQAAQAQVKELERLNHLKDDFLSTVSHELRSPMSNIKMATQLLEINLKPLGVFDQESAPINRYFRVLREEGQREVNLINDLLDLARLDAGTEPIDLTSIDLQSYIPHVAESFLERAQQQQQHVVFQVTEDLPALMSDRPSLERILTELLHNACKYTPAGETITVSAQSLNTTVEIRVSNSGVEIPMNEHDRIFDKFYRIPNSDPWKHGGTGLGLALVKKLIERLHGTIRVESGDGQTTFILEFRTRTFIA